MEKLKLHTPDFTEANIAKLAELFPQCVVEAKDEGGAGSYRIGGIAEALDVKIGSLSPRRAKLIKSGMIYSPNHGDLDFTVPLFHDFIRRAIPDLGKA